MPNRRIEKYDDDHVLFECGGKNYIVPFREAINFGQQLVLQVAPMEFEQLCNKEEVGHRLFEQEGDRARHEVYDHVRHLFGPYFGAMRAQGFLVREIFMVCLDALGDARNQHGSCERWERMAEKEAEQKSKRKSRAK